MSMNKKGNFLAIIGIGIFIAGLLVIAGAILFTLKDRIGYVAPAIIGLCIVIVGAIMYGLFK